MKDSKIRKTIPTIDPTIPKKNKPNTIPIAEINRATGQKISVSPPATSNTANMANDMTRNANKLTAPIKNNGIPTKTNKNSKNSILGIPTKTNKKASKAMINGLSTINVRMSGIMFHMIWNGNVKIQNGNSKIFRIHANGHEIQLNGQKFQINSTSG